MTSATATLAPFAVRTPPAAGDATADHRAAPSYYEATRAYRRGARAPLQGEVRADVAVVGGGYTGLSAALHLARAGRRTVLVEAAGVGGAASGRNGGLVIPGHRREAAHLIAAFGLADAKRLWGFGLEAVRLQRDLVARYAIACDLTTGGYVHAALTPRAAADAAKEADTVREAFGDGHIVPLDRQAVRALVGSERYVGGSLDRRGGWLHPLNYALGLAEAAEREGAVVHEHSRANAIVDTAGGVSVETDRGCVRAGKVVIATDAFAGEVEPSLASYVMPVWNFLVATEPLGARLDELLPTRAAVSDSRFVLDYFRPTSDGRLVFGGGERYSPSPPRDVLAFVRRYLERAFPLLAGVRLDFGWGGQVSLTRTRDPILGRSGNRVWALGYSGQGVLTAPFAGALAAGAVQGLDEGFDLFTRFPKQRFPGGPLARSPLYVAGMAWYGLRDRIDLMAARVAG